MAEQRTVSEEVRLWLAEIATARKREKDFLKEGKRVREIYHGEKKDQVPFNILYSNTETLLPALFGQTPRPVVQRRFKDADVLGKLASQAGVRVLEYLMDTNKEDYAAFPAVMEDAVIDALVPGRGAARWKYEPVLSGDYKEGEFLCPESLVWDRVIFGYAKKWTRVPWIAFEHHMDKVEARELFGDSVANRMVFSPGEEVDKEEDDRKERQENLGARETCLVYEIWDKHGGKKVRYVSAHHVEGYCKVLDDPLELSGFFPMPEPLRFLRKANDQLPVAPYSLYENQAKELNRITTRINRVVEALKVRGAYDSTVTDLASVLKADDNVLVPAENVSALQDSKGLEHAIWLMPIDKLVTVLQQLVIARQHCKQVIYEITGISDILRGQTQASETATAQEIKNQWGTLRLKRMQREVQRFVRDMLRIALEIAGKRFSEETFSAMTGMGLATGMQKQQAQQLIQLAQQSGQEPDPQAGQIAQAPSWEEVIGLLRDTGLRSYRIDIETNSTVDPEATEDQKHISEAMTAISQFLQGVGPLVENGSVPFEVAREMLLTIARRFRFGTELEDALSKMQPPRSPDEGKQQAEQAKQQGEQDKRQHEKEMAQFDAQLKAAETKAALAQMEREAQMAEREHQLKMEELERKAQYQKRMSDLKMRELLVKASMPAQKPGGGTNAPV